MEECSLAYGLSAQSSASSCAHHTNMYELGCAGQITCWRVKRRSIDFVTLEPTTPTYRAHVEVEFDLPVPTLLACCCWFVGNSTIIIQEMYQHICSQWQTFCTQLCIIGNGVLMVTTSEAVRTFIHSHSTAACHDGVRLMFVPEYNYQLSFNTYIFLLYRPCTFVFPLLDFHSEV